MTAHRRVALIRGINLGRAKRVAMADLRALVEALGYQEVRTLLNSGNVIFGIPARSKADPAAKIQSVMASKLGVSAMVMTLTADDFNTVVTENPFQEIAINPSRLFVSFVKESNDLAKLESLVKRDWSPDRMAIGSRAAYLWCPNGMLKSEMVVAVNNLLRERATARNWATVNKLHTCLRTALSEQAK
jgi:uncharacterized protein (DUF1697 family)